MHDRHTTPFRHALRHVARIALFVVLVFTGLTTLSLTSHADASHRPPAKDALPLEGELLAQPIALAQCGTIVEWKSSSAFREETLPSAQAIAVIEDACRVAIARYPEFLRSKGLTAKRATPDKLPSISLLPGNTLLDGRSTRNLNDVEGRFGGVVESCCYWGLYVDSLRHLFVRNDPLVRDRRTGNLERNERFVRTLQHELAHVLSARTGAFISRQRDEELAEEFVAYLGFHYPTESSSEDLAFHEGRR